MLDDSLTCYRDRNLGAKRDPFPAALYAAVARFAGPPYHTSIGSPKPIELSAAAE